MSSLLMFVPPIAAVVAVAVAFWQRDPPRPGACSCGNQKGRGEEFCENCAHDIKYWWRT